MVIFVTFTFSELNCVLYYFSRPPSGESVLKKHPESVEGGSRPGTTRARPIPELPDEVSVPRDPDKDSPDIFVSAISSINNFHRMMMTEKSR